MSIEDNIYDVQYLNELIEYVTENSPRDTPKLVTFQKIFSSIKGDVIRFDKFFKLWDTESLVLQHNFLFKLVLDKLLSVSEGKTVKKGGLVVSANDVNVFGLLMALYLDVDFETPHTGYQLRFDLHKVEIEDELDFKGHYVTVMLNDKPTSLNFCEMRSKCPLK